VIATRKKKPNRKKSPDREVWSSVPRQGSSHAPQLYSKYERNERKKLGGGGELPGKIGMEGVTSFSTASSEILTISVGAHPSKGRKEKKVKKVKLKRGGIFAETPLRQKHHHTVHLLVRAEGGHVLQRKKYSPFTFPEK